MKDQKFITVRVRKELKFKAYSQTNLARLKQLEGKLIQVRQISSFFYQLENEETLIFRWDFRKIDDEFHRRLVA